MANSLNRVMLIGNLGKDCETKQASDNFAITSFSIATQRSYKKNDQWEQETTWHNIKAFNASDYTRNALTKGAKVAVEGRISNRSYIDKDGNKKYVFEIIAESIILCDSKKELHNEQHPEQVHPETTSEDLPF